MRIRTVTRLNAEFIWINQYNGLDTAIPFGGCTESGPDSERGASAIALYTQNKSVNVAL